LCGEVLDQELVKHELEPILEFNDCDTVVLACTHFPLLNNEISSIFKLFSAHQKIALVDSGEAIARRVESLLNQFETKPVRNATDVYCGTLTTKGIDPQGALSAALKARQLPYLGVL
jgi:glutamate racemase